MAELKSMEVERVELMAAWKHFLFRLAQQRGEHKRGVQQSLLPMLEEMLLVVKEGFQTRELLASASLGRAHVFTSEEEGLKRPVSRGRKP